MKYTAIFILLFIFSLYGQNENKSRDPVTGKETIPPETVQLWNVIDAKAEALRILSAGQYQYFPQDTLKYNDSLAYFDFNCKSLIAKISVTAVAGDSIMFAIIDSSNNAPVSCAVIDLQTGSTIPGGTHIVPGAGTKHYMIKQPSPGKIRVRRSSTSDLNHNTYIKAWGVN
jgi:hypothetical protein